MAKVYASHHVEGTYGHKTRVTFRPAIDFTGKTVDACMRVGGRLIDLTTSGPTDDGCGGAFVDITWQQGELVCGCHEIGIVVTGASSLEEYPCGNDKILAIVRKGVVNV